MYPSLRALQSFLPMIYVHRFTYTFEYIDVLICLRTHVNINSF